MFAEGGESGVKIRVRLAHFEDVVDGVHHGRMMFRKNPADLRETEFENVSNQVHRYLARERDGSAV